MKKSFLFIIIIFTSLFLLISCKNNDLIQTEDAKVNIVTSIFSAYDWAKEISKGTSVSITNLTDNGVNLHNYEPTPDDISKIIHSDLFVYVGSHSDKWVKNILKDNPNLNSISLTKVLENNLLKEEIKEGMEDPDACPCGEDHHKGHKDEHVWLSLRNAKIACEEIANFLKQINPDDSDIYDKNLKEYLGKLDELDKTYSEKFKSSKTKTLVFGDRFPFRYLLNDYSIDYYAAFFGCSAESEASFETIKFLINKIDELHLNYIYSLSDSDQKVVNTIKNNSKNSLNVLQMNSLETVSSKDNKSYLDIMQENLDAMLKGLN